ncbi:MAG: CIA30 family protein [Spirulinaceae cyanobacterium]
MSPKINQTGVVLVAGATGVVGKEVVKQLQKLDYPVRVLVRSIARAKRILGEDLDFYEGDIDTPQTLQPELLGDVAAVICFTETQVQVESTPQTSEDKGVKNLVALAAKHLNEATTTTIFDFNNPSQELKDSWGAVDDVVMGGASQSSIKMFGQTALFSGNASVANSGGFASVRNRNFAPPLDLSAYEGFELHLKGDGKRYKFIARCEGKWDGISYCYSFDTAKSEWLTVRIPFAELIPVFRAKTLADADSFAAAKTYAVQLMYSKFEYDGELNPTFEPGYFELEVASIKAYGGEAKPQFVVISPVDVNLEEEPSAVKVNELLKGILTGELPGEDTVRESGLNYRIVDIESQQGQ